MPGPASGSPGSSRRKALSKRSGGSGMAPAYSVTCPCPVKLHTRAVPAGTVDRERPASSFDRIPLLPRPGLARWRAVPLPETPETSMTSADTTPAPGPKFTDLGLPDSLLQALAAVGYESPSPIQAATIPPLLAGRDVLGQAQTRSEEHTSELQSLMRISYAVFCLKKKKT